MPHKSYTNDPQNLMEYEFDNIKMPKRTQGLGFIPFVGSKGIPENHVSKNPEYMNDHDIDRRHEDYGKNKKYTVKHDVGVENDLSDTSYLDLYRNKRKDNYRDKREDNYRDPVARDLINNPSRSQNPGQTTPVGAKDFSDFGGGGTYNNKEMRPLPMGEDLIVRCDDSIRQLKRKLHVVYINDFFPELWKLTLPSIEAYADKHGYELNIISKRKFPEWHINYEKMQVYEDGMDCDVNLLVDADILIHPQYPDLLGLCPPNWISVMDAYYASEKLLLNKDFLRDGRDMGIASNFVFSGALTHDLYKPLEITPEEGREITLFREGDIDEYCLSKNMARYGIKYCGVVAHTNPKITEKLKQLIVHTGTGNREYALHLAQQTVEKWKTFRV